MRSPWHETPRRRAAWFALIAAVAIGHLLFGARVAAGMLGWNAGDEPRRIDVTLVRQLQPSAPPVVAEAAARPEAAAPRSRRAVHAARAASQARASASLPQPAASSSRDELHAEALALAAALEARAASASAAASAAVAASPASAASTALAAAPAASGTATGVAGAASGVAGPAMQAFEWPPSTRLTYTLTGQYRGGPLYGTAAVEWRRDGAHYQVQFDIHVSPFFDQHMFSDGRIGEDGLHPAHYDEAFKVPVMEPRLRHIEFGDDEVVLDNGNHVTRLPGTQDGASQFVQFVWMFATHPQWLRPGNVVDIPLALPRSLRRWRYLVVGTERLALKFGDLDAVHLKPLLDGPRRANEYPFEIWTAPTLQYLPVRIHVQVDEQNYADLSVDQLPLQAAEPPSGTASAAAGSTSP
ncbi:MAG: DUF3108 domain-containing protein [Burkholderiaceae bacterium]